MIKLNFLSENKTNTPDFFAEHGLSIFIETNEKKIVFDLGASEIYRFNAVKMNVDLSEADFVVISHGHYDHTEGLTSFCETNKTAPIYIHENAFSEFYGMENDKIDKETCGIRIKKEELEKIKDRFIYTKGITKVTDNIYISGTIKDVANCEPPEQFFIKEKNGKMIPDDMSHEQFLVIRDQDEEGNSKGLYVFSGCSHKGIVPCLEYVKEIFPDEKINGFIAGMHLYNADKQTRKATVDEILKRDIPFVMPVHCTGINGICELKGAMDERCIPAGAGDIYLFE